MVNGVGVLPPPLQAAINSEARASFLTYFSPVDRMPCMDNSTHSKECAWLHSKRLDEQRHHAGYACHHKRRVRSDRNSIRLDRRLVASVLDP